MPAAARHRRTRPTRHRVRECARLGGIPATYNTSYIDTTAQNLIDQINATLQAWETMQTNWNVAFSQTHTRDALGRITQTQEIRLSEPDTKSYTYDPAGRLTSATVGGLQTTWGYDLNGNRIAENGNVIATYDSEDRLQSWKGNTYTYNAAGDLASKTTPAGITNYTYDAQGSLRKVVLANGKTITYAIDPAGRRTGKTVNGALQWQLVWMGGLRPLARLKANNTLDQTYYYGDKPNVPEAMSTADGKTYRIISDQNGSVRLVIDAQSGEVAQQIDYDTWGQITNDTNPGFQPFGFAGGLYDPDTGLTRFGARDYDAETGRWTAKDPILFGGGDSNLFGYTGNDPVNGIDPAGLWAKEAHDYFIDQLFGDTLSAEAIAAIKLGSDYVDGLGYQFGYDYMHAMRSGDESVGTAKGKACAHFKSRMHAYQLNLENGRTRDAYISLGMALHTVMDATSPVHSWKVMHWVQNGIYHGDIFPTSKENLAVAQQPYYTYTTLAAMLRALEGSPDFCGCQ